MWISPGKETAMPQHTCPNCLSGVSAWDTKCPFCKADLPAVERPGVRAAPPVAASTPALPAKRNRTLKALIIGYLVLFLSGTVGVLLLMLRPLLRLMQSGVTQEQAGAILLADPGLKNRILIFGLLTLVVAGFVSGRIARERELYHATMIGLLSLFGGLVTVLANPHSTSTLRIVLVGLGTLPLALFGGYLARFVREQQEETDPTASATVAEPPPLTPGTVSIPVSSLWIDRWGRYLYPPLFASIATYLVPEERAESFDRDVYRFVRIAGVCGGIFAGVYAIEPKVRVLRIAAVITFILLGRLWKARDLVPVNVTLADIVKYRPDRTRVASLIGRKQLIVYLVLSILATPIFVLYAVRVSPTIGSLGVILMVGFAIMTIGYLRRLRQ